MAAQRRVVIIGAGIVGCTIAEELTRRGWTDVTVLEQGPLVRTGGSTSHAPGLVLQVSPSKTMTTFARQTVERFSELELNGEQCFNQVGSLEFALTDERWAELHRRQGLLAAYGVESAMLTAEECGELLPMLDPSTILGGLHLPTDGLAKPVLAGEIMMREAESRGARFLPYHRVSAIRTAGGQVTAVVTEQAEFAADIVVCCAGFWGQRIGQLAGVRIPLSPMQHFYAKSAPVPARAGTAVEASSPIVRHLDGMVYFREHYDRLGFGFYGHDAMPIDVDDIPSHEEAEEPSKLPFTGQEHCEQSWQHVVELLPGMRETKLEDGFNGIFSFTPDGMPILGESKDVAGFWAAEAVWITHSAGVGRAMAEWIVDGVPGLDMHECDINRFDRAQLGPDHLLERNCRSYDRNYDIIHPLQPTERPWRYGPCHARQEARGAVFHDVRGWARPRWYEANAPLAASFAIGQRQGWEAQYWSPIVGAEHLATRARAGLFDLTPVTRLDITGPSALGFLQRLTSNQQDRPVGAVTYSLLLDVNGGVRSEITVARMDRDSFRVVCDGGRDLAWFARHARGYEGVELREVTSATCALGLWGPRAEPLLRQLLTDTEAWRTLADGRLATAHLGRVPVSLLPISHVGEPGFELHTAAECGPELWDVLSEAGEPFGLVAAGTGAFHSLRVESGLRFAGVDMTTEHSPYEAGLGFAVSLDKRDFIGRDAIAGADRPGRRLVSFALNEPAAHLMGSEPVFAGSATVGLVTSAAYSYGRDRTVGFAWLPAEHAEAGTPLEIQYFDRRLPATVDDAPALATTNLR